MTSTADSLLARVWAQVVTALDQAAEAAHHLNTSFGLFCEAIDRLHTTLQSSRGEARTAVQEVLDTVAVAARVLWALQLAYLDGERLVYAYIESLDGNPPPRTVEFPGHVEPDAHFGPNPNRHHPALVKVPLVQAAKPDHRTNTWAIRVRRGMPEHHDNGKTEGKVYRDSSHSWELVSGFDHKGGLTKATGELIERAIENGFFAGAPPKYVAGHAQKLRHARTHVEAKAAAWARNGSQKIIDVVINRDHVCGDDYDPARFETYPGCFQAVELILRQGQVMRVWTTGDPQPVIIRGKA